VQVEAERELGTCLFHGIGVAVDHVAAVAHYRSAAAAGDPGANFALGWRHFRGEGTQRCFESAEKW
jgi:TPR repeat protein